MKKIILLAASLLVLNTINAQDTKSTTETVATKQVVTAEVQDQKTTDGLNNIVTLTEDQKAKVLNLATEKYKKIDLLNEKYKNDPQKNNKSYGELQAIKTDFISKVKLVLTSEQQTKLKESNKEKFL